MAAYTPEIAAAICDQLASGKSLLAICKDPAMPSREAVRQWVRDNSSFREQYEVARRWWADCLVDDLVDLADNADATDNASVQKARLAVDARKWVASKLLPGRFGDKIEISGDGGAALQAAPGPAQIPQLMSVLAVLLPGTPNNELHGLASKLIERAAPALPAPGGDR